MVVRSGSYRGGCERGIWSRVQLLCIIGLDIGLHSDDEKVPDGISRLIGYRRNRYDSEECNSAEPSMRRLESREFMEVHIASRRGRESWSSREVGESPTFKNGLWRNQGVGIRDYQISTDIQLVWSSKNLCIPHHQWLWGMQRLRNIVCHLGRGIVVAESILHSEHHQPTFFLILLVRVFT